MFGMFIFDHYQPDIYISYQNTTKTLTFVTLFLTLFYFKHSFLTNETLNSHRNHIYNIFTYISTNHHIFLTKYSEITIKQRTSKTPKKNSHKKILLRKLSKKCRTQNNVTTKSRTRTWRSMVAQITRR